MAPALLDPVPQLQIARELRFLVVELAVLLVGGLRRLQRAVTHVLHAQRRGDHQHLRQRLTVTGLQDHAAHARVQRQPPQFTADGGQLVGLVHGIELPQQGVAIGNGLARRCFQKGKLFHRTQAQRLHAQDHPGQRRTQDLGVGEAGASGEVLFVVQADAHAIGHPPAAARALLRRCLADGLHLQLLHLAAVAVTLDARQPGVNDETDARHRERRLGHVGREHDAPAIAGREHAVLLGLGEPGKQRQDVGRRPTTQGAGQVLSQVVRRFPNLALTRQEDQDIASCAPSPELVHRIGHGGVEIVVAAFLEGPPAQLHREQAARDLDDRRLAPGRGEVPRKALGVDGGRGDHHLQVRPTRQQLPQVAQQEVDVQAALMGLVDDERVIGAQQRVGLRLGQQDAVGHQLDRRARLQPVLKAHLVADHIAQGGVQLLGDALGHAGGRDPTGLGVTDQPCAARAQAAPEFQRDLGQLGGLARPRFAADDDHLMLAQGLRDLLPPARYRQ